VTVLSRSALVALSRVLNALRDGWLLEKRLAHVARMIVEEARAQRLSVEQMLSALTDEWPRVLELRRSPDDANAHMLAERLANMCESGMRERA
jgi:hypothetical protein